MEDTVRVQSGLFDPSDTRDLSVQLIISAALGLSAFLAFCILRPRWTSLYAARKVQKSEASLLPELPDTMFGWVPVLYRITDRQVLASAGLDAFVFLSFFRMAIKFLTVAFLAALIIMTPVNIHFKVPIVHTNPNSTDSDQLESRSYQALFLGGDLGSFEDDEKIRLEYPNGYYWMPIIFVYAFTGLALYLLISETRNIIRVRQDYLGSQSTITDRTIRLSGIPNELRSEDKIKNFIEKLEIGKVESVTLCKNWKELDDLVETRSNVLRRLEEAWTAHLGLRHVARNTASSPSRDSPPTGDVTVNETGLETSNLLGGEDRDQAHVVPFARDRPTTRVRYGRFNLRSKKIDAIDYYEERMRRLDEKITTIRESDFEPTPLAFITMDSTAACAILDPAPMQLLASPAPAPSDVVWTNTYQSRTNRMVRAWVITFIIGFLTIFWTVILIPFANILNLDSIERVWPQFRDLLDAHPNIRALVQTSLPTLVVSLLNIGVPYLYEWLSNKQGMTSQDDVELSIISKNFFFTFVNLFLVFTITSSAWKMWAVLQDAFNDSGRIARELAKSLETASEFYVNLIVLQGLGLFAFRLLEFGSVALYPIAMMGAKTPRDYAEMKQPPVFKYGFYLPQTILVFILCIVYSVFPTWGVYMLFFGLIYFLIGSFTYKYQLLYAMDHSQHSTGRAWPSICYRTILGIVVFQIAMAGWVALRSFYKRSLFIVPLILATVWFSYFFAKTYEPLTKFIALRNIRREGHRDINLAGENVWDTIQQSVSRRESEATDGRTVDEAREIGARFVHPNLVNPLEKIWIKNADADGVADGGNHIVPESAIEDV
ncbi:MAG: hypothetical protein M4579_005405 [Chaenotheca gracillima]|nr:MAG: hypothetical protein M4579_005405 [Chaenotheca gracillima]